MNEPRKPLDRHAEVGAVKEGGCRKLKARWYVSFRFNSFAASLTRTLAVHVGGPRRGTWGDHEADVDGGVLELLAHVGRGG